MNAEGTELDAIQSTREWAVMVFALLLPTVVTYFYFVAFVDHAPSVQVTAGVIGKTVQFVLPVAWVFLVARKRLQLARPTKEGWLLSLLFGTVIFLIAVGFYHFVMQRHPWFAGPLEGIQARVANIGITSKSRYVATACFYSLIHSGLEEYYWRWFVFDRLKLLITVPNAILVSSVGFMAHHVLVLHQLMQGNWAMTILLSISVAVGGLFWAWMYNRTKSIWPCWISHAIVDAAIFTIGYLIVFGR